MLPQVGVQSVSDSSGHADRVQDDKCRIKERIDPPPKRGGA
jgi:hypothetical protein